MPPFSRVLRSLRSFWVGEREPHLRRRVLPPITYPTLNIVQHPPQNSEITAGTVTIVAPERKPRWSMFLCPCGCKSVITLSLQAAKRPHWTFRKNKSGRPTLNPSIWRDVGCLSHFFLEDGRIYWCNDTGISPTEARALLNLHRN